ncbi:diphosphomevalonate decarboxylase [Tichowtungia aerotolerans]|uniref:diphosphomevalonate decarboxylase n=1 Tax=Tichowtungia aerotolerans TaxID=2697043 RepID=A0A6P1MB26_9BACT|nr:diphosphomevalonate decarboxylase [Tichowtungia aerotolerans]QHI69744.1 diphosphomevalonate decarboxylase [Tichowtungia aerotolerans]
MMTRQKFVDNLLQRTKGAAGTRGEAFAPANIALCKYWGKRNEELNLPVNSSLSVSLGKLGTRTIVKFAKNADRIYLNGKPAPEYFASRTSAYLDLFRPEGVFFEVRTKNNIPTGAGLASSASGFAALVKALDQLFDWRFNPRELSMLARLGSGSATRSLYGGFAVWHAGQRADGMDSYAECVYEDLKDKKIPAQPSCKVWKNLCVGILEVSKARKPVGSTDGMNRTRETSELYNSWPHQAACDYDELRTAIAAEDFPMLGKTAENNALAMHSTMMAAWPPLCYWKPQTVSLMNKVWKAREDGLELFFTIDAGPNLKLLFLKKNQAAVKKLFPKVQIVSPF